MNGETEIAGLVIHSTDPLFLSFIALHVSFGLAAVSGGLVAMISPKRRGRHSRWGLIYVWSVTALFGSACALGLLRGAEDLPIVTLGAGAFVSAWIGRSARRGYFRNSTRVHLAAMGCSYILMLTAFYVETGEQLPLWDRLPHVLYWIIPGALGVPLIVHALLTHPMAGERN
jgi:uncharacterized membrane protein HdeD (DUF308 family)